MASDTSSPDRIRRARCPDCNRVTRHEISVEIRTEASDDAPGEFARTPYRVTECRACGRRRAVRTRNGGSL